jgi:hypothetical protein
MEYSKDKHANNEDLISKAFLNTHENINAIEMTLETSHLPISLLKTFAVLRLIYGREVLCEMRFACVCVNVRMRSECIT